MKGLVFFIDSAVCLLAARDNHVFFWAQVFESPSAYTWLRAQNLWHPADALFCMIIGDKVIVWFAIVSCLCCVRFSGRVSKFPLVCYFSNATNICYLSAHVINCNPQLFLDFGNIVLLWLNRDNSLFKSHCAIFEHSLVCISLNVFKMIEMSAKVLIRDALLFGLNLRVM